MNALFIVLFVNKNKKTVEKVAFQGPQVIVAGTFGNQVVLDIFPGFSGSEKTTGDLSNGFPGFRVASLLIQNKNVNFGFKI